MLHIYVDADACPVKREIYKVAERYELDVTLVSNTWLQVPSRESIKLELVSQELDAADDWIAERMLPGDIVITNDVPLAGRCVKAGASVLSPTGRTFDEETIGHDLATRDLLTELRGAGEITRGPPPMKPRDRSNFLQELDKTIQGIKRRPPADPS